ncbi:hypothetical protein Htur_5030 (plasmid) [Haloterrigena turkmenica DSM 5511]|uniref:Uncharacterized protein n=1 Tax=Haloterrigena turkmenica (strain ATCC 51198 / DSM 5511 / JCM 9101 / NCIMB 13204 / VKM B-1734 / 4k) TaxID=543526 RepID=D2S3H1_HALTV|nr:hypothetical protein [Haloterrigena turkmenica]ADB63918.1 hypothetical protein Htur_5030 [Haloterrigena turkmenica DSM 5511]
MNWFNTIVAVGIAIILVPALLGGGWIIAFGLALAWLAVTFGGRIGLDIFKERQSGATAAKYKSRTLSRERDDGQRWDR